MKTTITVQAVSFKTRSVKACNDWAKVDPAIDLKVFNRGNRYTVETDKGFDGRWYILKVIGVPKDNTYKKPEEKEVQDD